MHAPSYNINVGQQVTRQKMRIDPRYTAIVLLVVLCCGCKPTAKDYRFSARQKYERGDYAGAITDYTEVLRLKPDDQEAYTFRGIARAHKWDFDGGIADCTAAIRLNPSYPGYLARGDIRHKKGDESGAIADFTQAILFKPDSASAYFNRGVSRKAQGNYKEAITDLTESIRLNQNQAEAYRAYQERSAVREVIGDHLGVLSDSSQVVRLKSQTAGVPVTATPDVKP
jgi:tetratricopeptide (TPR) repeat protein